MPRQLCTTSPVMDSASPPIGAWVAVTEQKWRDNYSDLVRDAVRRISMAIKSFRRFLMAERDKRGETA